jgi:hypothetical protein
MSRTSKAARRYRNAQEQLERRYEELHEAIKLDYEGDGLPKGMTLRKLSEETDGLLTFGRVGQIVRGEG